MQRQLRLLVENNAKAHTQGTGLAKVHTKAYSELLVSVRQTARVMQADFAPIVEKVGFAATSTGLAFGGLTAGIAAVVGAGAGLGMMFQNNAQNLTRLHQSTGMAIDSLRAFEALAPKVGASAEQMDESLRGAADRFDQLRRFPQAAAAAMQGAGFLPALRSEVLALNSLKPEEKIKGLLDIAERIRNTPGAHGGVRHEKEFLSYFNLPTGFADYPGKIRSLVTQTEREVGHMSDAQIAAGNSAAESWQALQTRLESLRDMIGAKFVPALNSAYDVASKLTTVGGSYFLKLSDDVMAAKGVPSAIADIRQSLEKEMPAIGAALKAMLPDEREFAAGIGELIKDIDQLKKIASDPNWLKDNLSLHVHNKMLGLDYDFNGKPPLPQAPIVPDVVKRNLTVDTPWGNWGGPDKPLPAPGAQQRPITPPSTEGPQHPSVFDHLRALLPSSAPTEPPAPLGRPSRPFTPTPPKPWETMPTFSQSESAGLISRASFTPGAAMGGASSSRGDAVAIIAAGTRRGVADGMYDFWQTLKGMKERSGLAGVTPASFETGAGGPGGDAGGGGAAAIGNAVRRQSGASGDDPGASGGGSGTGRKFMDALSRNRVRRRKTSSRPKYLFWRRSRRGWPQQSQSGLLSDQHAHMARLRREGGRRPVEVSGRHALAARRAGKSCVGDPAQPLRASHPVDVDA